MDTLLTGNFLRDGEDLRITSQLIDVKTQNILWKGAFDLKYDKLLTVQDSVAQQIVKGLQLSLSPKEVESLRPEKPVDPLAYEYYLRGVDLYAQNEFPMAIKMLRRSAAIDPSYSPTWAHLGRSLTANASFELGGRDEYREAQAAYEKALSLQPAPIEASIYMANLFTDTGQVERAVPLLREALKNKPEPRGSSLGVGLRVPVRGDVERVGGGMRAGASTRPGRQAQQFGAQCLPLPWPIRPVSAEPAQGQRFGADSLLPRLRRISSEEAGGGGQEFRCCFRTAAFAATGENRQGAERGDSTAGRSGGSKCCGRPKARSPRAGRATRRRCTRSPRRTRCWETGHRRCGRCERVSRAGSFPILIW